jgi:hypothetical protein
MSPRWYDGLRSRIFPHADTSNQEELNLECDNSDGSPFRSPESQAPVRLAHSDAPEYAKLSQALHAALPSREDVEIMWKAGAHVSIYFHRVMMAPYPDLERNGLDSPGILVDIPGPNTHPVLLAKYIFFIATVLQYLDSECYEPIKAMSEPPRVMMKRLVNTAISLVTTHDELLDTVEGLECVMMEGMFQANCGNLRRAWIAFRRAMAVGQLMGIHRAVSHPLKVIEPRTKFNAQLLWYRIVYTDRFLCLMLGLPQASLDRSMASESALANDTPMGRLERIHCAIASRILERNNTDPGSYNFATTQEIDLELQEAAKTMPSRWWLAPNLAAAAAAGHDDKAVFWERLRLVNQLFHYNLLNQLHLPFMLRFTSAERRHDYSQATCVNASREVLSRFVTFRSFNRVAYCCRAIDFFALMAALTLLLAHLDSHRRRHPHPQANNDTNRSSSSSDLNFLAHQRLGDRAMMEQVVENMDQIGRESMDALSAKSAGLLRRLLAIEAEAANGRAYSTQSVRISEAPPPQVQDEMNVLRIRIPYFGTIRIAREGVISKEAPVGAPTGGTAAQPPPDHPAGGSVHAPSLGVGVGALASSPAPSDTISEIQTMPQHLDSAPAQPQLGEEPPPGHGAGQFTPQFPRAVDDSLQQQYLYPGLTAGADDWAFQGVDMAFFDSLMRGSMLQDVAGGGGDWAGRHGGS